MVGRAYLCIRLSSRKVADLMLEVWTHKIFRQEIKQGMTQQSCLHGDVGKESGFVQVVADVH